MSEINRTFSQAGGSLWPSGTVLRATDGPSVFVLDNGRKRPIPGPQFAAMAANENIVLVYSYLLVETQDGPPVTRTELVPLEFRTVWASHDIFQDGARHIGTSVWTMSNGTIRGVIRYESDSNLEGTCGGTIIGIHDDQGTLIHFFTPPLGCCGAKFGGTANQRFVEWQDTIPENLRERVARVTMRTIFTEKTWQEVLGTARATLNDAKRILDGN